jgi:primosomal protein N''
MARRKPTRDKENQFKELQEQDYEDELEEMEEDRAKRDSGVSRHRSKDRDKRSSHEEEE